MDNVISRNMKKGEEKCLKLIMKFQMRFLNY